MASASKNKDFKKTPQGTCFSLSHEEKQFFEYNEENDDLLPLPRQLPKHRGQMTVVLDMDETLLHSVFLGDIAAQIQGNAVKLNTNVDKVEETLIIRQFKENADVVLNACGGVAVFFRPGLHDFLEKLSKLCEVVLWTAAERDYAEPVLEYLDPDGTLLPHRLFREHTVVWDEMNCVKDLRLLGRNLKRTMLIDNNTMVIRATPTNCVLIEDFYGDPHDNQLEIMWAFIEELNQLPDIRPSLKMSLKASRILGRNQREAKNWEVQQSIQQNETALSHEVVQSHRLRSDHVNQSNEYVSSNSHINSYEAMYQNTFHCPYQDPYENADYSDGQNCFEK